MAILATMLGPILVIAGFALYMTTNTQLGRFRWMPWEFLAVSASGVLHSLGYLVTHPAFSTGIAAAISVALGSMLGWFFFSFSMYGPREDRPRVGDRFPHFILPASDGGVFDLAAARGRRRLLLFYRWELVTVLHDGAR
jgi:hypothetical protein